MKIALKPMGIKSKILLASTMLIGVSSTLFAGDPPPYDACVHGDSQVQDSNGNYDTYICMRINVDLSMLKQFKGYSGISFSMVTTGKEDSGNWIHLNNLVRYPTISQGADPKPASCTTVKSGGNSSDYNAQTTTCSVHDQDTLQFTAHSHSMGKVNEEDHSSRFELRDVSLVKDGAADIPDKLTQWDYYCDSHANPLWGDKGSPQLIGVFSRKQIVTDPAPSDMRLGTGTIVTATYNGDGGLF